MTTVEAGVRWGVIIPAHSTGSHCPVLLHVFFRGDGVGVAPGDLCEVDDTDVVQNQFIGEQLLVAHGLDAGSVYVECLHGLAELIALTSQSPDGILHVRGLGQVVDQLEAVGL